MFLGLETSSRNDGRIVPSAEIIAPLTATIAPRKVPFVARDVGSVLGLDRGVAGPWEGQILLSQSRHVGLRKDKLGQNSENGELRERESVGYETGRVG